MRDAEWSIADARTLTFDDQPIDELHVRLVSGAVNVVESDAPTAEVEVAEVAGQPLVVRRHGGRLSVSYEEAPWPSWQALEAWLGRQEAPWRHGWKHRWKQGWKHPREQPWEWPWKPTREAAHRAVVSISVPTGSCLSLGLVHASAVVSGLSGRATLRSADGDLTLVGLTGPVHARTASGSVEAQSLRGRARFHSASGDLTLVDSASPSVTADTVSGSIVLDVRERAPAVTAPHVRLNAVSGSLAVRLPAPVSAEVSAHSAHGTVTSGFPGLTAQGHPEGRRLAGVLGGGVGSVRCATVSGAVTLLRRPDTAESEPVGAGRRRS